MIITVTLNSAVDKTYTVPNFSIDRVHRPTEWRIVPGGKGINVARVCKELGMPVIAMGFAGGHNGAFIREGLEHEGLPCDLVPTSEESRVCITVIDPERKTQTELNENGPAITVAEIEQLTERVLARLPGADALVLSGSIPPGVPAGIYATLISTAREHGVTTVLDSSGQALAEGLAAGPDIAKPNLAELSHIAGRELITAREAIDQAMAYIAGGVSCMLISMGRSGAMVATADAQFAATPPEIPFVSAVGSGDSFVAGFLYGRHNGWSLDESLRIATAAGSANAMTFGAGMCSKESIMSIASQVQITRLGLQAEAV